MLLEDNDLDIENSTMNQNSHDENFANEKTIEDDDSKKEKDELSIIRNEVSTFFLCKFCKKEFSSKSNLVKHLKKYSSNDLYNCSQCDVMFNTMGKKINHEKRMHNLEGIITCKFCKKIFQKLSNLNQHIKNIHNNNEKIKCNKCKKEYANEKTLKTHKYTVHEKNKDFICNICEKKFTQKHNLLWHQKKQHNTEV